MDYQKLKEILAVRGKTQREMCMEIGINEPSLSGIKSGSKKAGIEMILKISKYLDIHPPVIAPEYKAVLDFLSVSGDKKQEEESIEEKQEPVAQGDTLSVDMSYLISIGNNLSISNKELAISTRELATTTRESNNAMIEFARLIILKDK